MQINFDDECDEFEEFEGFGKCFLRNFPLACDPGIQVWTDIQPCELLPLEEECILEAAFQCYQYYDAFLVLDPTPLKCAIEKVYPWAAMKMKDSLHMTVSYPGKSKVPGLSKEYDNIFTHNAHNFPFLRLYIREICASTNKDLGSAVVAAIDSAIMFDFNNNGTPAHLTLWGYPPVKAGRMLIGKPLTLRNPFITVTDERVLTSLIEKVKELEKQRYLLQSSERNRNATEKNLYTAERKLEKLQKHCTILERVWERRVTRVQSHVRRWLAQLHMRRLRQLTPRQRVVLMAFLNHWMKIRAKRKNRYSIYDDEAFLENFMGC